MTAPAPLRVHVVIDSMGAGGAELLLADFAAGAAAADVELSFSYLARHDSEPARERLSALGFEPAWIEVERLVSPAAVGRIRARLRDVAPDVVHTHLAYSDALGGIAARSLRLPTVSTIHVMHVDPGWREAARERLIRGVRQRCAARTIFVSDAARRDFLARTGTPAARTVTVHNGVIAEPRPGAGRGVRAALGIGPEDPVVGMLSVLRAGKGHEEAIAAVARLRAELPALRLLVVGDGPRRRELERAAAGLGDAVVFAGYRDDAMSVLDSLDILLHPSRFDAFPTALLEAMSAGVPVVASAVGGIPEIVADGETGTLVDPAAGAAAIAAALSPLLADRGLRARYAAAGSIRFQERFTAIDWARRMRALYDDVAGIAVTTAAP